jgi:ribosomal protein L7/L12
MNLEDSVIKAGKKTQEDVNKLSKEQHDHVYQSALSGNIIEAIKLYRKYTGDGLAESKNFVYSIRTRIENEVASNNLDLLKESCGNLSQELRKIIKNSLISNFLFMNSIPKRNRQYWQFTLDILGLRHSSKWNKQSLGFFTGNGSYENAELDINRFFKNNRLLFDEIVLAYDSGRYFSEIYSILKKINNKIDSKFGGAGINLYSCVYSDDSWIRSICQDYILAIHIDDDDGLMLVNQMSEIHKFQIETDKGLVFMDIPFDKHIYLKNAQRVD